MSKKALLLFFIIFSLYFFYSCAGGGGGTFGGGSSTVYGDSDTLYIQQAIPIDDRKLAVKFSEPVTAGSAQNVQYYELSGTALNAPERAAVSQNPAAAQLLPDNRTVVLTLRQAMKRGSNFTLKAQLITNLSNQTIKSQDPMKSQKTVSTVFLSDDIYSPVIEIANVSQDRFSLVVKYSELVDPVSAADTNKYYVRLCGSDLDLSHAAFSYESIYENDSFKSQVKFSMSQMVSGGNGDSLEVTVHSMLDLSDSINHGDSTLSTWVDLVKPQVVPASCIFLNQTTLLVRFSEIMDQASVEQTGNYFFDYGLNVLSSKLQGDRTSVQLSTSIMTPGRLYHGEVRTVFDLTRNEIDPAGKNFTILYALNEPTNLQAEYLQSQGKTRITWEDDPLGTSYKVYRHTQKITAADVGQLTPIATGIGQGIGQYLYTLVSGTEGYFFYAVVSVHADESIDSDFSGSNSLVNSIFEDNVVPDEPTNVSATYNYQTNLTTVTWTDVSANSGEQYKILRYNQQIRSSNYAQASVIGSGLSRNLQSFNFSVPSPTSGTYYYAVLSYDSVGNMKTDFLGNTTSIYEDNQNQLAGLSMLKVLPVSSGSLEVYFKTASANTGKYLMLRRAISGYPQTMTTGDFVYSREISVSTEYSFLDNSGLQSGREYYYSAFVYDDFGRNAKSTDMAKVQAVVPTMLQPCSFTGTASYFGTQAAAGMKVRAFDPQGVFCGFVSITSIGSYYILVYGDDSSAGDGGADPGDTITFYLNGYRATALGSAVWQSGETRNSNLKVE
ncbi:MAG: hypothetical protein PHW04_08480 [Candidatus Wallbacteria bacterium]|nr:hypothetical protein [Candidatus Wallbacteria bacterium]